MIAKLGRKLLFLLRRSRFEAELAEEMRLHVDLRAGRIQAADPEADAECAARRRFGNATLLAEHSRDVWTWQWLEDGRQDLRFAGRLVRRKPGFSAFAVVTLALGIGAATAVFSILNAVLLRPLPYRDPGRLVAVWDRGLREKGLEKIFAPYTDYEEWRRSARSFESIAAATWAYGPSRTWTGAGPARELLTIPVSATFFDTLGVPAALGRTFTAGDERHGCTVVLAHDFWAGDLGANRSILGRSMTLDQQACAVVGIMPPGFRFYPPAAKMWILMGPDFRPAREKATVGIFARLKPGVTRRQAQAEVDALARASHPGGFWHDFEPVVYNLQGEFTFLASRTLRATLITTFAAVLLLLLIAALNVANLQLARLAERRRELAVRAALGSGRARLVRQVLAESLLLAALGTLAGIAVAFAGIRYFRFTAPIELTAGSDVVLNLPVLAAAAALGIATTVIFGLVPAAGLFQFDLSDRLGAGGRGMAAGALGQRMSRSIIATEMALSFLLLTGAGLLLRSALRMGSEPLGFDADRLFQTATSLPPSRYREPVRRTRFYESLLEGLSRLPGVEGVALTSKVPPYAVDGGTDALEIRERPTPGEFARHDVGVNLVSPGFFRVVRTPLLRGRDFDGADRAGSLPVAIVNDALVRRYFPGVDPLGRQVRPARPHGEEMPWLTIVGLVGNLKHAGLMNEMSWVEPPVLYRPLSQSPPERIQIAVRALAGSRPLEHELQRQITSLDASLPVNPVVPVRAEIARSLAYPRFRAAVLGFFSLSALLMAAVGLNGVLSQVVARRTAEFGLRKAVGAQQRDLLVLVARRGGGPVLIGMLAGIGCTVLFRRLLAGLLYQIEPADPVILALISLGFLGTAALAIAFPARRAARVDPVVALRDE